jgi:hypothetical protein
MQPMPSRLACFGLLALIKVARATLDTAPQINLSEMRQCNLFKSQNLYSGVTVIIVDSWKANQPDNLNGSEHCLVLDTSNGKVLLEDVPCSRNQQFICEVRKARDNLNFETLRIYSQGYLRSRPEVVEAECSSEYDLTTG